MIVSFTFKVKSERQNLLDSIIFSKEYTYGTRQEQNLSSSSNFKWNLFLLIACFSFLFYVDVSVNFSGSNA